mmetsp:Transcript_11859/g.32429  ORF Transcript_11859/g.32429 Transcript_11859/m.32429 type:complete len:211 (+) Transcript_11859:392-1024(+)
MGRLLHRAAVRDVLGHQTQPRPQLRGDVDGHASQRAVARATRRLGQRRPQPGGLEGDHREETAVLAGQRPSAGRLALHAQGVVHEPSYADPGSSGQGARPALAPRAPGAVQGWQSQVRAVPAPGRVRGPHRLPAAGGSQQVYCRRPRVEPPHRGQSRLRPEDALRPGDEVQRGCSSSQPCHVGPSPRPLEAGGVDSGGAAHHPLTERLCW